MLNKIEKKNSGLENLFKLNLNVLKSLFFMYKCRTLVFKDEIIVLLPKCRNLWQLSSI